MKLSKFSFDLPPALIAQDPAKNRDEAKLMVLDRKTQTIQHLQFKDILNILDEGDLLLLNNTKVFPARMYGNKEKTGAKIEVFLLRELNEEYKLWDV
jgi:S-adenosylmethionine:tRNA ribosyltransferase-isomerase